MQFLKVTVRHILFSFIKKCLRRSCCASWLKCSSGKFRFDFSHTEKVRDEKLNHIFEESNKVIFNDFDISTKIMNIDDAKEGALAFFGDKYDDDVRVVSIGVTQRIVWRDTVSVHMMLV